MDKGLIAIFVLSLLVIIDKVDHNRIVEKLFPDDLDPKQCDYRHKLHCHMIIEVMFLIGSALCMIAQFIGMMVKK